MFIKIKSFLLSFFLSLGLVTIIFLLANYFAPQTYTVKYLWAFSCMVFIISLCGAFVFKTGVSYRSLWIRRGIMMAISLITWDLVVFLLGIIKAQETVLHSVLVIIGTILFSCIAFRIADKVEKRNIQKINDKLNVMNLK